MKQHNNGYQGNNLMSSDGDFERADDNNFTPVKAK